MADDEKHHIEIYQKLKRWTAVGEAFGYYFNEQGEVVHKVKTVGIQLDDLRTCTSCYCCCRWFFKGKSNTAYMKQAHHTILITDEGAANELLKG